MLGGRRARSTPTMPLLPPTLHTHEPPAFSPQAACQRCRRATCQLCAYPPGWVTCHRLCGAAGRAGRASTVPSPARSTPASSDSWSAHVGSAPCFRCLSKLACAAWPLHGLPGCWHRPSVEVTNGLGSRGQGRHASKAYRQKRRVGQKNAWEWLSTGQVVRGPACPGRAVEFRVWRRSRARERALRERRLRTRPLRLAAPTRHAAALARRKQALRQAPFQRPPVRPRRRRLPPAQQRQGGRRLGWAGEGWQHVRMSAGGEGSGCACAGSGCDSHARGHTPLADLVGAALGVSIRTVRCEPLQCCQRWTAQQTTAAAAAAAAEAYRSSGRWGCRRLRRAS